MSNVNTIFALTGGTGRNQVLPLTVAAVTETVALQATDTAGTTVPAVLTVPGSSSGTGFVGSGSPIEFNQNKAVSSQAYGRKVQVGAEAPFYNTATFDAGRPFVVRVSGRATALTGTGNTLIVKLYLGTSATVGSDTLLATISAGGASNTSFTFLAEATIQWDSIANVLGGSFQGQIGNTITARTALASAAATTSAASLNFVVSYTWGNAVGGTVTTSEFSLDQI